MTNRPQVQAATALDVSIDCARPTTALPPQASPAQRRGVTATQAPLTARYGLLTPASVATGPDTCLDEPADVAAAAGPGDEECPAPVDASGEIADIDEVAVAEAMRGRLVPLTLAEQMEAVGRLTRHGCSLREIAALLHISARTVSRRRGVAAREAPSPGRSGVPSSACAAARGEAAAREVPGAACGRNSFRPHLPA
jgi:predicted component of type VI protein secretion system